jgi:1,4-alpha-glucan branching enzyme
MKILEVYASYFKLGGVQIHIRDLCRCLRRRDHHVTVLTYAEKSNRSESNGGIDIESFKIPNILLFLRYPSMLILCLRICILSLKKEIDVIHVHSYVPAIAASLAKKFVKKPVVATFHLLPRYTDKPVPLLDFIEKKIRATLLEELDGIIAISKWNLVELKKSGINNRNMILIRNWLPKSIMDLLPSDGIYYDRNLKSDTSNREVKIILIGRLVNQKGFDIFIQAANILLKKNLNFKAKIIGKGPERDNLLKLCEKLGLENNVELVGLISDSKKTSLMNSSDIFVISSRFEGLPLSILEAMYLKKAIVATDVNGINEVITNGVDGLLAHPNVKDLAQKLELLMTNHQLIQKFAQNARKKIEEKFSFKNCEETASTLEMVAKNV